MFSNTGALCQRQRRRLIHCSSTAKKYCATLVLYGRRLLAKNDILSAQKIYLKALEAADILLDTDPHNHRAELRYSRTAAELAWIYRRLDHHLCLSKLKNAMLQRLRFMALENSEYELMKDVEEAYFASDDLVGERFSRRLVQPAVHRSNQSDCQEDDQPANVVALY